MINKMIENYYWRLAEWGQKCIFLGTFVFFENILKRGVKTSYDTCHSFLKAKLDEKLVWPLPFIPNYESYDYIC